MADSHSTAGVEFHAIPVSETRTIPLTQGKVAIVDEEDYERVNQYKWYANRRKRVCYAVRTIRNPRRCMIYLHRFILGVSPDKEVDHVNGDPLDNRRCNLRLCTHIENCRNCRKQKATSSRFKGVWWQKASSKWRAMIVANGLKVNLGLFASEEAAHAAYCEASVKYHGEFGRVK